jgi:hypothetical protein
MIYVCPFLPKEGFAIIVNVYGEVFVKFMQG